MSTENQSFEYTYSAAQQEEVKRIREKYTDSPKAEEDKMARLRRLDENVTGKSSAVSLAVGIISAVVMGTGMSLVMTDIGSVLGLSEILSLIIGIAIGAAGIVGVSLAYPLYNAIIKKERERIAPEILKLTDELMK